MILEEIDVSKLDEIIKKELLEIKELQKEIQEKEELLIKLQNDNVE